MEKCENCGRDIGNLETPYVVNDHIVCVECHAKLNVIQLPEPIRKETEPVVVDVERIPAQRSRPRRRGRRRAPEGNGAAMAMGIAALILGVIALATSWIPFLGLVALPLGGLGILIGLLGVVISLTTAGRGIGFPLGGIVISGLAVLCAVAITSGTASAIGGAAKSVSENMNQRKLERLEAELDELQSLKMELANNRMVVKQVSVDTARLTWDEFASAPTFELTVSNNTDETVTRIYMAGKATSPNKPLPYVEDNFNYSPPGGMPADATETLKLRPNFLSDWSQVPSDDPDVQLQVQVIGIETPEGELRYELDEYKQERLEELPRLIDAIKN